MSIFKPIDYKKHFVIGSPLVAWKCDKGEHMTWLQNRISIAEKFPNAVWFSSFETDHRGLEPFRDVMCALQEVGGKHWTFTIDDMRSEVTSVNRLIRIETGRNLIREFAQRPVVTKDHSSVEIRHSAEQSRYSAVLYVDSDVRISVEIVEKLMEIDHPLVGVDVPAYGLRGKLIHENPRVEEHWTTAGLLWVNEPAFYDLPWHHNAPRGLSDDPAFQFMAERLKQKDGNSLSENTYGMTWVRKDISASHEGLLVAVENRRIPDRKTSLQGM